MRSLAVLDGQHKERCPDSFRCRGIRPEMLSPVGFKPPIIHIRFIEGQKQ